MEARERILEKTNDLFNRHGIRRVTMDDIATQCGMSKKTIYQYFKDKDELVDAYAAERLHENRRECEFDKQQAQNSIHEIFLAMDALKIMFETLHAALLHDLEKYHPGTYFKFRKHKEEFLYNVIKANLEWGLREGLYRDEIDIDVITRFRLESMLLPFNMEIFPESRYHLTMIQEELMEHFLYGIVTDKGRKIIIKYKNQRLINKKANV